MTDIAITRGEPTAEEVAALVAVLCARPAGAAPLTGYEAWRRGRLAALNGASTRPR
ncbi:hypothetical protein GCM10009547_05860 [Sporichthya brevicatena]|uniref:Acyl-CoA carboxylase subunit epsilon n=1 Tax=Sporichthya brevicatena TaxID=171442 RepID=A0ABN1G9I0_9ACTN